MKRFQFISRIATSVAAVALTLGTAVTFTACEEEITYIENEDAVEKLAVPATISGEASGAELSFSWDAVEGAFNYAAQIRHTPYGDVIGETITELTSVTFADLENGDYVFRVRANDEFNEKKNSEWSAWMNMTVYVDPQYEALATPQDVICVENESTENSLTFKWEVVENAVSYTYKVTNAAGEEVMVAETESLSAKIENLEAGASYTLVVKANPAADSDKYRSSSYSKSATGTTVGLLATPANLENTLRMAEALSFKWEEVANAGAYMYELYEGTTEGEPLYAASTAATTEGVETTNTSASFMGLKKDTYYSFRVKAVPAEGAPFVESPYTDYLVVKTLITDATPLNAPMPVATTDQISATIAWNPVSGAVGYKLQFGASQAEAEASEPIEIVADELGAVATEYTFKNLTAATDYVVRILAVADPEDTTKIDSEYSAWVSVKTLELLSAWTISTADELLKIYDVCKPGAVVTLKSGNYITDKTIKIEFAISLIGESATNRPVVNLKQFTLAPAADEGSTTCSKVMIQNIEFTGYDLTEDDQINPDAYKCGYFIDNSGQSVDIDELIVDNCIVANGFTSAFMRMNRVNFGVKNLTVTNNIVATSGRDGAVFGGNGKSYPATKYVFKNNTFEIKDLYTQTVKNSQMLRFPTSTADTFDVVIENNTFHNIACLTGKNLLEGAPSSLSFKKNIITIVESIVWANKVGINPSETVVYEGNFIWNYSNPISLDGFTNVDPGFTNYVMLQNYTPTNADVVTAGAGDTRWLK
ncbi:MAG: hypothetical protein Q4A18_02445 [Rikenellaceae bacterium]|nr:hypothetical protein [Rikenellaceae bacterium]